MSIRSFITIAHLLLLVGTLAAEHDPLGADQYMKTPQERYEEELSECPSTFQSFVSTVDQIRPPTDYNNSKLFDDPRFSDRTGPFPKIYRPYPDYDSIEWRQTHRGSFRACEGPRGKLLDSSLDDQVAAYLGLPDGFPEPIFGSYDAVGIDGNLSFDRYSRYGAYGFGENETEVENWIKPTPVDWNEVNWGELQQKCYDRNLNRFSTVGPLVNPTILPETRSAILIRTYTGKEYLENDIQAIRAIITELSLQTGGENDVFLLLHVKDEDLIGQGEEAYRQAIRDNIPKEFWDITIAWDVPAVASNYPALDSDVIDVHHSQWLPIQDFTLQHPEYEYIWNWEIDSRYTGHNYEFVNKVIEFARDQPRRGLWERNARFYIPSVHGNDEESFREFVRRSEDESVWGPFPVNDIGEPPEFRVQPSGPTPPVPMPRDDSYEWGVGEEADYISFLPIFHPVGTEWVIRNEVHGFIGPITPRRACLITHARISRRLLIAMHGENLYGRHMGSELFPPSMALLHGFKAVAVPHPVFSGYTLPPASVDRWFNPGVNGRAGSTRASPFSWGRESRFRELSWYYRTNLPGRLYWPFLGWEKEGTGGPSYEREHGRVCLPSILFHPVKDVQPDADNTHNMFDFEMGLIPVPGPDI